MPLIKIELPYEFAKLVEKWKKDKSIHPRKRIRLKYIKQRIVKYIEDAVRQDDENKE